MGLVMVMGWQLPLCAPACSEVPVPCAPLCSRVKSKGKGAGKVKNMSSFYLNICQIVSGEFTLHR